MALTKRILITGATSGIGKEAAYQLAKQGAEVIIHGRNAEKAAAVKHDIIQRLPDAKIDVVLADLSKKVDILWLAAEVNADAGKLDVLINNAGGVMNKRRELTEDGWEKTIAVNVLAPFMLSALLYPKLSRSLDGRIINTASMAHRMARPNPDDLMYEQKYNALRAYGDAKLFVILLGKEFARRQEVQGRGNVTMNAFHPGVVASNFAGESNSFYHFFFKTFRPFLTSVEKGADTMVYLAAHDGGSQYNGEYFMKRKRTKIYRSKDPGLLAKELWGQWEDITGISFLG